MSDEKILKLPFRPLSNKLDMKTMAGIHGAMGEAYLQLISDAEEQGHDPLVMVKRFSEMLKKKAAVG